jgi:hypothetical protein
MSPTEAGQMALLIKQHLPDIEPGTLRFWGEWFGRPYDNQHRLITCEAQDGLLRLHFNEGEVLSITAPKELHVGPSRLHSQPILRIREADRIRWAWFYYGRPRVAANLYFYEFVRTPHGVEASTNVDWYTPHLKPIATEPAAEFL